nr:hypothetical protein [Allobaculum stercoricanis]
MKLYFPSLQLRIDWLLTNPQDQEDLELMHQKNFELFGSQTSIFL